MKKFTLALCILQLVLCTTNTLLAQSELWGLTPEGCQGFGTIFKTDGNGNNQQVVETFMPGIQGFWPVGTRFVEMSNGKLIGVTSFDGQGNGGVIFEYDPATNVYVKKIDFSTPNGRTPNGPLYKAANGKLYGLTSVGGAFNKGVIYEYDYNTNTYTKKVDFDGMNGNAIFGIGGLIEASNGKLYGTTGRGGVNDEGVLFEYDYISGTYIKKFDMDSATGRFPLNSLMEAGNGKLYGTARDGGAFDKGVIFEYDYVTSTYTKKIDLTTANGQFPAGHLIEVSNGILYGMTATGGATNDGVIFEYNYTTNAYTKKYDLNQPDGWVGGSLMKASNGKLYGLTRFGGANEVGVLFEYDYTTTTYTKKVDLTGENGDQPIGTLVEASNGKLYGTANYGGMGGTNHNDGVIFEYDFVSNTFTKKIDFNFSAQGHAPAGALVHTSSGKVFGTTRNGGANGLGVIFEYDRATSTYLKKYDFTSGNGFEPSTSLTEATNGKLYGIAAGGATGEGVIYEFDPATGIYTKKIDLVAANGTYASGDFIVASNGKLYGTMRSGGLNNDGVIFEYTPATNTYIKKIDFNSSGTGSRPVGSLVQAPNGKLYGMTGVGDFGVSEGWIYEYDIATNTYTTTYNFTTAGGRDAEGSLMLATNGKLYGMTSNGGANNEGVIFEYDPNTHNYIKKYDFGGTNGKWPIGTLMQASNGKLYGMTWQGGATNNGILFEFDYTTGNFSKKLDFNGVNGRNPTHTHLIEIMNTVTAVKEQKNEFAFQVFPNPSRSAFTIHHSGSAKTSYHLKVINQLGSEIYTEPSVNFTADGNHTFDMSKYPKGIYFIELSSGHEKTVRKIILQ